MNYFRGTPEQRFWRYVNKTDMCWLWTACIRDKWGYGCFWNGHTKVQAHRWSWENFHQRKVPSGMVVCHHCDNTRCVRPEHLFIGSQADNISDRDRKGRGLWRSGQDHWVNNNTMAREQLIARMTSGNNPMRQHPEKLRGERNGFSKLTQRQVEEIRSRYERGGVSQTDLAREFGVNQPHISRIIRKVVWCHSEAT